MSETSGCYQACCPLGATTGVSCPPDSCDLEEGGRDLHRVLMDAGGVRRERNEARALCNRWIEAALRSAGTNFGAAFDPMNPEVWMHAQTKYVLDLVESLATSRAALEDWQRKAGEQEMRAILAEREANERGAVLEDVRRVETWLYEDITRRVQASMGSQRFYLYDVGRPVVVSADSLEALGHALIQEAGNA